MKQLYEGILGDIETNIDINDVKLQSVLDEKKYSFFTSRMHIKNGLDSISVTYLGKPIDAAEKFIAECCSYDGKVLTIDLTKDPKGSEYQVSVIIRNDGISLPLIKVIEMSQKRLSKGVAPNLQHNPTLTITTNDELCEIDVAKFIHPDTIVTTLEYDSITSALATFKSNKFPGKVKGLAIYNCDFEKIDKKAWPKCPLKFTRLQQMLSC